MELLHSVPDAPELPVNGDFFIEAFWTLSTDRHVDGMGGVGQLPWSSIDRYAERFEIGGELFALLVRIIRALDRVFLADVAKRLKAERDKSRD